MITLDLHPASTVELLAASLMVLVGVVTLIQLLWFVRRHLSEISSTLTEIRTLRAVLDDELRARAKGQCPDGADAKRGSE